VADIASRLGLQVTSRGSLELLDVSAARQVVEACLEERVAVLGIEGFRVDATRTVPDMGAIADLSTLAELPWLNRVACSVADAGAFLHSVTDSQLVFDIALVRESGDD